MSTEIKSSLTDGSIPLLVPLCVTSLTDSRQSFWNLLVSSCSLTIPTPGVDSFLSLWPRRTLSTSAENLLSVTEEQETCEKQWEAHQNTTTPDCVECCQNKLSWNDKPSHVDYLQT